MERIEYIYERHHVLVPVDHSKVISSRSPGYYYPAVAARFDQDAEATHNFLAKIRSLMECAAVEIIPQEWANELSPYWQNGYFYDADARALIAILLSFSPKTYLEIGGGNSTKFARYAVNTGKLGTRIVSIDPEPRVEIDALCDEVIRKNALDCSLDIFRSLQPGDILFCDGSHLVMNGTDTVYFWLEIFPALTPGVLVHIHDIHLPYEYDASFDRRGYGEQYMLAAALLNSDKIEVLLPVAHLSYTGKIPWSKNDGGGSFWFRKKA